MNELQLNCIGLNQTEITANGNVIEMFSAIQFTDKLRRLPSSERDHLIMKENQMKFLLKLCQHSKRAFVESLLHPSTRHLSFQRKIRRKMSLNSPENLNLKS